MTAPAIAVFFLLCMTVIVHLVCCFGTQPDNTSNSFSNYADYSKPLLMPLLALAAAMILIPLKPSVSYSTYFIPAQKALWLITFALLFGTAGDILLLDATKTKRFIAGTTSFFIGHIFYLCISGPAAAQLLAWSWGIAMPAAAAATFLSWLSSGAKKDASGITIAVYTMMLCMMLFCSLAGILTGYSKGSLYIFLGTILFILSDGTLSFTLFVEDFYPSRFVIMLTYIAAQLLIVFGAIAPYLH